METTNTGELIAKSESLMRNPDYVTVNFRRHSNRTSQGVISAEGIENGRSAAEEWAKAVKDIPNAEVSFSESPSFMNIERESGEVVRPMRASITASLYEKALTGEQSPAIKDENGKSIPGKRERDGRLGDLLEYGYGNFPAFFKALGKTYGGMNDRFWHDYVKGTLDPAVKEPFEALHGSDSLMLAEGLTNFMIEKDEKLRGKATTEHKKEIALALTHGEALESLLYHLGEFLKKQEEVRPEIRNGMLKGEEVQKLALDRLDYNQAVDAHIGVDGELIVQVNDKKIETNLLDFRNYLTDVRLKKNAHTTQS